MRYFFLTHYGFGFHPKSKGELEQKGTLFMSQKQTGPLIREQVLGMAIVHRRMDPTSRRHCFRHSASTAGSLVSPQEARPRAIIKLPRFSIVETESDFFFFFFTNPLGGLNPHLWAAGGLTGSTWLEVELRSWSYKQSSYVFIYETQHLPSQIGG